METFFESINPDIDLLHLNESYLKFKNTILESNINAHNFELLKPTISIFLILTDTLVFELKSENISKFVIEQSINSINNQFKSLINQLELYLHPEILDLFNDFFISILNLIRRYNDIFQYWLFNHSNDYQLVIKIGYSTGTIYLKSVIDYWKYLKTPDNEKLKSYMVKYYSFNFNIDLIRKFIFNIIPNENEFDNYKKFLLSNLIESKLKNPDIKISKDDLESFLNNEKIEFIEKLKNYNNENNIELYRTFLIEQTYLIFKNKSSELTPKTILNLFIKQSNKVELHFDDKTGNQEIQFLLNLLYKNNIINRNFDLITSDKKKRKSIRITISKFSQNLNSRNMKNKDYTNLKYEEYKFLENKIPNIKEIVNIVYKYKELIK